MQSCLHLSNDLAPMIISPLSYRVDCSPLRKCAVIALT